jgi:hypothetical protein
MEGRARRVTTGTLAHPGNPMTTGQLNQSAFALGFRTIDCSLDGGLDRVSVLLALRFAPLGLCFADTLPSGLVHFLGKILVATGINLFREEILTMQFGLEISQHLPRGLIGCLGFNAAESIIPQSRHAIPGDDAETNAETNAARSANGSTDVDQSAAKEDSPPVVPEDDGLDLPAALRRTDDEKQYEDFEARWEQYCGAAFAALPAAMQSKFASELLGKAVIATAKKETRH